MNNHDHTAAESVTSETVTETSGETLLATMIAARHALFDDVTTVTRDEDDLPIERGASGRDLRWAEVLGDAKLDSYLRKSAKRLYRKHSNNYLDDEIVAQCMRVRIYKGADNFRVANGLAPDAELRFKCGNPSWDKYVTTIIRNECARQAGRMEREAKTARLMVSRDFGSETDAEGDELHWREALDYSAALSELAHDELQIMVEEVIRRMTGRSRRIIELYYREKLGQRTLAQRFGMALSSFQSGPWSQAKSDFIRALENPPGFMV